METLTLEKLNEAIAGDGVGIRARTTLEPLGGRGDKIFPPTYSVENSAQTKYATETRRVDGEDCLSVLLDSVASQANRFELALLEAYRRGEAELPLVSVDFSGHDGVSDLDRLSVLEAPHRIYDAILRDSLLDGVLFRLSEPGRAITEATPANATALFHYSPTTLLFGGWDSTGPKGGRGSKFERTIVSEVIGLGIAPGVKTGSRLDPLGIERNAATIYESDDELGWTIYKGEATRDDKGEVKLKKGGGEGSPGRPSHVNHGNVTPSIDERAGGVTVDEILAVTVLSFAALRRLRFPHDTAGKSLPVDTRLAAEAAARTAIAALGVAATVLAFEDGFDLRSRCALTPVGPLRFELLRRGGVEPSVYQVDRASALSLLSAAREQAGDYGLSWHDGEVLLDPAERLVELVRRSRALAAEAPPELAEAD